MKVRYLKIRNWLILGLMSLCGLVACKKEPLEPKPERDYGEIVPCYGVYTCAKRIMPVFEGAQSGVDSRISDELIPENDEDKVS